MQYLDQKLRQYSDLDVYPFHMPGHKRKKLDFPNPYEIDITEIDGFDNLHHARNILKEAQQRAADFYGSRQCYYLVNGSTCGLLAAICAATRKKDKVLVARNCHKAVYHALYLNELSAEYLYPVITENDLQGKIAAEQVEEALCRNPDISAVILTSPTYEGIISDIARISEICHVRNVPLIVDEAHGAHLGFGGGFPENAIAQGADAVIMSLHKTFPSFTQTALLHVNSDRICTEQVERYLGIFETSSPSYIFMAGMDACIRFVAEQREQLFESYRELLDEFYRSVADLKSLHVMTRADLSEREAYDWDDSKLVIFTGTSNMTGEELHRILLEKYHLQMEMVSGAYVLGMTSIMDEREGFVRLATALHEMDEMAAGGESRNQSGIAEEEPGKPDCGQSGIAEEESGRPDGKRQDKVEEVCAGADTLSGFIRRIYRKNPREMQIYQALDLPYKETDFEKAVGQMSAEYLYLYPPGIPFLVPGEVITRELIANIRECRKKKLAVEGLSDASLERIKIVYF